MSTSDLSFGWNRFKIADVDGSISRPVVIDDDIIFLTNKHSLYRYHSKLKKWNKNTCVGLKSYPFWSGICLSKDRKHLYVYNEEGYIEIIDIEKIKVMVKIEKLGKTGQYPMMMVDPDHNELLHIIGGSRNNKHFIVNINSKEMKTVHTFDTYNIFGSIVYIQETNIAVLFSKQIPPHIFNFETKKWESIKIKVPMKLDDYPGCVAVDKGNVLLFCKDGIWIFHTKQRIFNKSQLIKVPKYDRCLYAILTKSGEIHLMDDWNYTHWIRNVSDILKDETDEKQETNLIEDVMVISLAIGTYSHSRYKSLERDVSRDLSRYNDVFIKRYGYEWKKNYKKNQIIKAQDVLFFFENVKKQLITNNMYKKYGAIIITLSSHGVEGSIVCSDGSKLRYEQIRSIFNNGKLAATPKIYLIDCCRNMDDEKYNMEDIKTENELLIFGNIKSGRTVRGGKVGQCISLAFDVYYERIQENENEDFVSFQAIYDLAQLFIECGTNKQESLTIEPKGIDKNRNLFHLKFAWDTSRGLIEDEEDDETQQYTLYMI